MINGYKIDQILTAMDTTDIKHIMDHILNKYEYNWNWNFYKIKNEKVLVRFLKMKRHSSGITFNLNAISNRDLC